MINKSIILITSFFIFCSMAIADSFNFETKNLEIFKEKNQIITGKGKAFSSNNDLEINADKFEYLRDLDLLKTDGNGKAIIQSKKLIIKFDKALFDQKNSTIKANGNVKIHQTDKNFFIESEKIFYDQLNNLISSNTKTILKDNFKNTYIVDSFMFEIDKNILKVINLESKDKDNNILKTEIAYINTLSGKLFGKDVNIDFDTSFGSGFNKDNEPRLKAVSINRNENITELTKGVFTTCKKQDDCPPWEMTAKKIHHNKTKKTINYENAFLKIYDIPVMYFPKFFHPDPTVKRQSGFLIPTIKNSSGSDGFLNTPYFFAIAENKDATFSPRFYPDDKVLFQTEYRQANLNSNHIADFSYFTEKGKNSKNHIFYEYDNEFNSENFENNQINFKIQQTSNDTYLKSDKLESVIVNDSDILENSLGLDLYSDDLSISLSANIYEDLNKNNNDRYEYELPRVDLVKSINNKTNLNGNFIFESQSLFRSYNTNVNEKTNTNDLKFKSFPKITSNGFYNNYEFLIKNSNMNNENSTYKNNENIYLSSIFQYNSSLPLIKEGEIYQKILKPKISLKFAPQHTKDDRNAEDKIDLSNIYSINRLSNKTTEGGFSVTYGGDYSIFDNKKSNEIFNFKLASNLRLEENDDLSNSNQMGEKTSNLFSEIVFSPNEYLTTKYNNSLESNLKDTSYENLITEFKINNFVTKFDYLNENNTSLKNSYLTNESTYSVDQSNSLSFSTRKNKKTDLTEYYNLMYQYKNDCLAAAIEYNKDYYSDRELKPTESIFFKLTIIPFGQTNSPNLKND
jgi:LPS-assembly protein